ncbi:MAG: hypothetical protein IJW29_06235 [Clostridia bacterium]|nr:hypothetical protein [Clostridia bacterium]
MTTPTAIPYEDAIKIARAELERIMDHLEDNRPDDDDECHPAYDQMWDIAQGMWSQMTWTLAQVYGLEYEEVEGDLG